MTARARKATTTTTPAAKAPAVAPVTTAASNGKLDLNALASQATNAAKLPTVSRGTRGPSRTSALTELVTLSFTDKQAKQLPPVAGGEATLKSLTTALRRAASLAGLGVSVRGEIAEDGMVTVTFQGKAKAQR